MPCYQRKGKTERRCLGRSSLGSPVTIFSSGPALFVAGDFVTLRLHIAQSRYYLQTLDPNVGIIYTLGPKVGTNYRL